MFSQAAIEGKCTMSKHFTRDEFAEKAEIRFLPEGERKIAAAKPEQTEEQDAQSTVTNVDRNFEMPKALYGVTVGLYLAFLAIMAIGLASPGLIIPMAIFAFFIIAGFGLPALWTRIEPTDEAKPQLTLGGLAQNGIMTATGHMSGRDATVQMIILPVVIVMWGLVTVTIAAIVT
jgi:hypothetical protein